MILRALFLASFAIVASVPIHSSYSRCGAGGGGIVACGWLNIGRMRLEGFRGSLNSSIRVMVDMIGYGV